MRVLNIKETRLTRKTRGGLISEGAYNRMYFLFCLQVNGLITGGAGLISGSLRFMAMFSIQKVV